MRVENIEMNTRSKLTLCTVGALSFIGYTKEKDIKPNIIVILVDDLGYATSSTFLPRCYALMASRKLAVCMNDCTLIPLFGGTERNMVQTVGQKHDSTGWNAYRIAHRKHIHNLRDYCIFLALYRNGKIN